MKKVKGFKSSHHNDLFFSHSFAHGRGTAVVVDAGAEFTSVAPVYEGTVLLSALRRSPVRSGAGGLGASSPFVPSLHRWPATL